MTPRSAARHSPRSRLRASRIFFWADCVIVWLKPIAAPFVHVLAHLKKPVSVCRGFANLFRTGFPAKMVIRTRLWTFFTPWKRCAILSAARRALPFRLCRQTITLTGRFTQPFAVSYGIKPGNRCDRLLRMIEVRIRPGWRRRGIRVTQKTSVFGIRYLASSHREFIDPNLMNRAFILLSAVRSHPKPSGGNPGHRWNDVPMGYARCWPIRHVKNRA